MQPSAETAISGKPPAPLAGDLENIERDSAADDSFTVDDYMSLPEGAPYQLIGGQLIMSPSPTTFHQDVSRNIEFALLSHVKEKRLGYVFYAPMDVCLTERDVYQPDILFVSNARRKIIGRRNIEGAPDLIVEVLSPSTGYYDLRRKYRTYEETDVLEYWIVDPDLLRVDVFRNAGGKFELFCEAEKEGVASSSVVEGFRIDLEAVFEMSRIPQAQDEDD